MWNCRMYPASPNSFLCSAPESNCSYSLPLKCIWFHWTATMLCRTSRGKAGRELKGFVAISVGVAQVLRGATELLWMQQRQMESWKCWREHWGLQSWEARMHTALHTLLAHGKVEYVGCKISSVHWAQHKSLKKSSGWNFTVESVKAVMEMSSPYDM